MTGWAQIYGFRGPTEDPEKMRKRVQHGPLTTSRTGQSRSTSRSLRSRPSSASCIATPSDHPCQPSFHNRSTLAPAPGILASVGGNDRNALLPSSMPRRATLMRLATGQQQAQRPSRGADGFLLLVSRPGNQRLVSATFLAGSGA